MKIYTELNNENRNVALALGFFDGVHLGHQVVIKSAVDFARENGKKSAVITFKEHPQVILRGCAPEYISTEAERRDNLAKLGVDFCYELDFSEISGMSGEDYVKEILVKNFAPVSISTGFNHNFGAKKSGTPELLVELGERYGYKYFKIPPVEIDGEIVSSSLIRKKLALGDICAAEKFLGRPFAVTGTVQKGAGLASKIGFKTANIAYPAGICKLPYGVYAVRANGMSAIANFGVKPTFEKLTAMPILEVHILNFDKDIYGEALEVEFLNFIRAEKKFASVDELVAQIKNDIDMF
ncbi:MAG: riboflavin biosynthesis protein RibF [Fusobacterium sp.]|nr:riboflavin biosynthesis protein RibF [Fusobacterium sp.]